MRQKPRNDPNKQAKQERSRFTVEAIVSSAAQVLVKEGYERATTNRIAAAAGVSVGSLYQYFPSKDALLAELIGRNQRQMQEELQTALMESGGYTLPEIIRTTVHSHLRFHAKNPALHRILIEQLPRVARLQANIQTRQESAQAVRMLLEQFPDQLRVKDFELASFMVISLVDMLTQVAVLERTGALTDDAFENELVSVVLRYLLNDEPPAPPPQSG